MFGVSQKIQKCKLAMAVSVRPCVYHGSGCHQSCSPVWPIHLDSVSAFIVCQIRGVLLRGYRIRQSVNVWPFLATLAGRVV